jgi:hypothetical protein
MRNRPRCIAIAICALALLIGGRPVEAKTRSSAVCRGPIGSTVTHADRYSLIYRRMLSSTNGDRVLYWGCLRATGKLTRLTEATGKADDAPISNRRFRTSRRFVAYVQTRASHGSASLYLYSFDLRARRRDSDIPTGGLPLGDWMLRLDGTHTFGIAELAVSDAGWLAWRTVGQPTSDVPAMDRIVIHDASGTRVIQAARLGALQGPSITGDTVTWTNNRVHQTYQLQR